jgi:hypothetical protein
VNPVLLLKEQTGEEMASVIKQHNGKKPMEA